MSSMPRDALKTSASKPGVIAVPSSTAERLGARDQFLRVGDIGRRDPVHDVGGRVAQHALRADVEDLDHARGVRGDLREMGAVEDRRLQDLRLGFGVPVVHLTSAPALVAGRSVSPGSTFSGRTAQKIRFELTKH